MSVVQFQKQQNGVLYFSVLTARGIVKLGEIVYQESEEGYIVQPMPHEVYPPVSGWSNKNAALLYCVSIAVVDSRITPSDYEDIESQLDKLDEDAWL